MTSDSSPLLVVGAGPAGLSAAITLARAGRSVTVAERNADVGSRFIGDWQILENLSSEEEARAMLARIGIEENFELRGYHEATFFDHRLRRREIRSDRPYGLFLRRGPFDGSLDRGLLAQARAAGATIEFGRRVEPKELGPGAILATGPSVPDGLAREMTFRTNLPDPTIWVLFDHRIAPGGYAYLFSLGGEATLGCAIVHDFRRIDEHFDRTVARFREVADFSVSNERVGYSYMNFTLKTTAVAEGGAYVAGEAAGFQDFLFGLGIRHALVTGHLAARAILEGTSYDRLWREAFGRMPEISLVNRFLYEVAGNWGLADFVRRAAVAPSLRSYLAGWYADAPWKRLLSPVVRRLWRADRCLHRHPHDWCRKSPIRRISESPELGERKK
jgi:flavin-dependent dehydrogenase